MPIEREKITEHKTVETHQHSRIFAWSQDMAHLIDQETLLFRRHPNCSADDAQNMHSTAPEEEFLYSEQESDLGKIEHSIRRRHPAP